MANCIAKVGLLFGQSDFGLQRGRDAWEAGNVWEAGGRPNPPGGGVPKALGFFFSSHQRREALRFEVGGSGGSRVQGVRTP